jgi:hypothetical protein
MAKILSCPASFAAYPDRYIIQHHDGLTHVMRLGEKSGEALSLWVCTAAVAMEDL